MDRTTPRLRRAKRQTSNVKLSTSKPRQSGARRESQRPFAHTSECLAFDVERLTFGVEPASRSGLCTPKSELALIHARLTRRCDADLAARAASRLRHRARRRDSFSRLFLRVHEREEHVFQRALFQADLTQLVHGAKRDEAAAMNDA